MMKCAALLLSPLLSLFLSASDTALASERVFSAENWFIVPDGTSLSPFFNPKDCMSDLPWDLTDAFSIAAGEIDDEAAIVYLPAVTQMTYVLSGKLQAVVKEPGDSFPSIFDLEADQSVLIMPGTFFQLRNAGESPCRLLYIVSPAYLFEIDREGKVVYDDSIPVNLTWEELEQCGWRPAGIPAADDWRKARSECYERLAEKKRL